MTHSGMVTRPAPVASNPADLEYDSKILWEFFAHNKNSTLDYGWLRNRVIRSNGKMSNDRQNAALAYLEEKDLIEKVSHGRWRFKKPTRPSAPVVASAPATLAEAAEVIPKFSGVMTDLVYTLLRGNGFGLTSAEIQTAMGIDNTKDRNNMSASLQSLERQGWIEVDRSNPRRQRYTALIVNNLGREPSKPELRHAKAPLTRQDVREHFGVNGKAQAPPVHVEQLVTSPGPELPAQVQQAPPVRTFTLEQVKHYGEIKAERDRMAGEIKAFWESVMGIAQAKRMERMKVIEAELRDIYGEG